MMTSRYYAKFYRPCTTPCWLMLIAVLTLVPAALTFSAQDESEIPEPTPVSMTTKDGLKLKATYYGQPKDKQAVPIVMLHEFKGSRMTFDGLASGLQRRGHVVLVPDLRGHGESTKFKDVVPFGDQDIETATMRRGDFANMVLFDMEAVRKFLVPKNDEKELNLEKLCIIGTGMGAMVAVNWAAIDWSAPPLAVGKQGQDVKAMVLVSPPWNFKGVPINRSLLHPSVRSQISMLILVGRENSRAARDAKKIYKNLQQWHTQSERPNSIEEKTLHYFPVDTSLQSMKLLRAGGDKYEDAIANFIDWRVVNQEYPWSERSRIGK